MPFVMASVFQLILESQDNQLDQIGNSVGVLKHISHHIGSELDEQNVYTLNCDIVYLVECGHCGCYCRWHVHSSLTIITIRISGMYSVGRVIVIADDERYVWLPTCRHSSLGTLATGMPGMYSIGRVIVIGYHHFSGLIGVFLWILYSYSNDYY